MFYNMLFEKDFRRTILHDNGFGGQVLLMTHRKLPDQAYAVKYERQYQSYNEYIGQYLIAALGYDAIPAELMQFSSSCAGAIKYLPDLRRVGFSTIESLSSEQKRKFIGLFILNGLINNPDVGEFYLNGEGKVCCLDLGETLRGITPWLIQSSFRNRLEHCLKHIPETEDFSSDDMIDAASELLFAISDLDMGSMQNCFDNMGSFISRSLTQTYQMTLEHLKEYTRMERDRYLLAETNP